MTKKLEMATFAGGCFRGVEGIFRKVEVSEETVVGHTGGQLEKAGC